MLILENERRMLQAATQDGDASRYYTDLWEGLRSGQVTVEDFSIRELFEEMTFDQYGDIAGREIVKSFRSRGNRPTGAVLAESANVNTAAFSNITGQITYSTVLESFENPAFIGEGLVTTKQATTQYQEIIPGVSRLGDKSQDVGEGENYPTVGLSEEWIVAPEKIKDGFIVPVTEEAIYEDKTGLLVKQASAGGESMGITKEKELLDAILGITTSYRRKNGAAQATYGNTHTEGDFDNLAASNALVDWTDIEAVTLLFDAMTDPNTGEPITVMPKDLIVPTALAMTARRILNATEIEEVDNQAAARTIRTKSANPVSSMGITIHSNAYVKNRTASASTWFVGDAKKAFEYHEIYPMQFFTQDRNSTAGFERDIVTQFKVRRKGVPVVVEPRYMIKSTA